MVNKYTSECYFGKKGSGKTSRIAMLCNKYRKQGFKKFYCNVPVKGTVLYDPKTLGKFQPEPDSVLFIDEIGLVFNNRRFKEFDHDKLRFFKLSRHYRCKIVCFSQVWDDSDKSIRILFDKLYTVVCVARVFSVARPIKKIITISNELVKDTDNNNAPSTGSIVDTFKYSGLPSIVFLPRWISFFDSYETVELPNIEGLYYPLDEESTLSISARWYPVRFVAHVKSGARSIFLKVSAFVRSMPSLLNKKKKRIVDALNRKIEQIKELTTNIGRGGVCVKSPHGFLSKIKKSPLGVARRVLGDSSPACDKQP